MKLQPTKHRDFFAGYHDAWNVLLDAQNEIIASFVHSFPAQPYIARSARQVLRAFHKFRDEQFAVYTRLMLRVEELEYLASMMEYDMSVIRIEHDRLKQEMYELRQALGVQTDIQEDEVNGS